MKLLDRQIQRELVGPFVFGVAAFSSVFFAGTYLQKLTQWVMSGLPLTTAFKLFLLLLPAIIVYTLPMATLLAVLLGIGRMSGESEVVALFAGGVSLKRIAAPIVVMGALVSLGSIVLNEMIVPRAHFQYETLQAEILKKVAPQDQPFTVKDSATNSLVDINGGMDPHTNVLKNVTVTHYVKNRPDIVVYADQAIWEGLNDPSKKYQWRLRGGFSQQVGTRSPVMWTFGPLQTREIRLEQTPNEISAFQQSNMNNTDQMSFAELSQVLRLEKIHPSRPPDKIRQLEVDRWNKLALPISSLIFAMLATPLGIRPYRSSSSVGFGLSILVILLYWMIWHYTSTLAVQGNMAPFYGTFTADALGVVAALLLLRRTAK